MTVDDSRRASQRSKPPGPTTPRPGSETRTPDAPLETAAPPAAGSAVLPPGTTPAMRLQILSTEHWSLLASRNLAWNESFTRAGMYLSTLSFSVLALAFVGQASGFGEGFRLFALVVLPVVLFLGLGTQLRLDSANYHDAMCIVGMNRIRATYLEIAPDFEPVFVMGKADDFDGIEVTMANVPTRSFLASVLAATPFQVGVLNAVLAAAIAALIAIQLGAAPEPALVIGVAVFIISMVVFGIYTRRLLDAVMASHRPLFPRRGGGSN